MANYWEHDGNTIIIYLKMRCYWERHWGSHQELGEPNHEQIGPIIVNIWQTIGNIMGTQE
jgi:hypothetical protein